MPEMKRASSHAFKVLSERIASFDGLVSKTGWFANSEYPGGRPVAETAAGNEFGTAHAPARPFMRPTVAEQAAAWKQKSAVLSKRVIAGQMSSFDAMEAMGGIIEGDVAATIASIHSPPLSKITLGARKYRQEGKIVTGKTIGEIARKLKDGTLDVSGVSDKPLEDTFTMLNTLTHITEKT